MNEYESLLARGGLSLERLATLCLVVEAGGLSKAAGGDVSRLSLYSRQVKELEAFFGIPLGRKVGRMVVPTDEARAIAAAARAQFKALQSFVGAHAAPASFTLAASHSLLEWHVLPRLPALADALGPQRLRLIAMRTRDVVAAVEDHRVEVGLVRSDAVPRGMPSRSIVKVGYGLFVPKAMAGPRAARQILGAVPLALALGGQLREQFAAAARREKMELLVALECSSFTLALQAVRSGRYAAVLPDLVAEILDPRAVVRLDLPMELEPRREIVAVWRGGLAESAVRPIFRVLRAAPAA